MAATKTKQALRASASVSAGTTQSATEWDLSTKYGGEVTIRLTNGGSAPTTVPTVKVYIGGVTGEKRQFFTASGDTVNSSVTDIVCRIPAPVMFVNVDIINGATNAITAEVIGQELTTI